MQTLNTIQLVVDGHEYPVRKKRADRRRFLAGTIAGSVLPLIIPPPGLRDLDKITAFCVRWLSTTMFVGMEESPGILPEFDKFLESRPKDHLVLHVFCDNDDWPQVILQKDFDSAEEAIAFSTWLTNGPRKEVYALTGSVDAVAVFNPGLLASYPTP